jgi:hypothetical protein
MTTDERGATRGRRSSIRIAHDSRSRDTKQDLAVDAFRNTNL